MNGILMLSDDFLISGQRLCEWCGHGPYLEEDLGLSNMALDLLGSAQEMYDLISQDKEFSKTILIDGNREVTTQNLVYFRSEKSFFNNTLFETPKGHFGTTILKQLILVSYAREFIDDHWNTSLGQKIKDQLYYHVDHCTLWLERLSLGTSESAEKMQLALDELSSDIIILANNLKLNFKMKNNWFVDFLALIKKCHLSFDEKKQIHYHTQHTEHLGYLLAEMQVLPRSYPLANW